MNKNRVEAFSDGVLAIIITIMVLELKRPERADLAALRPLIPVLLSYLLSFIYIGIYWNNHHHLFHATKRVNGAVLWANLHLLFWLSLVPFATAWMGEGHIASEPVALYGCILQMAGVAYYILQSVIIADQGPDSLLRSAIGFDWKGKSSLILYFAAIGLAFVNPWISVGLYTAVAFMWLIPDTRIERRLRENV
ncbi:MAG: TMEM175 family protein [Bryobacteraceae bacterium]|nr:TMEM175 family protein [Bryobacteraceae bacterium]